MSTIEIKNETVSPYKRYLNNWKNIMKDKSKMLLSRSDAYAKTKDNKSVNIDDYIARQREKIINDINSKAFGPHYEYNVNDFMVMESFSKDMEPYIDTILDPIREKGYTVVNLKERVPEMAESNYYLILWNTL